MDEIPDLDWNTKRSHARGVGIRCPFATVDLCPRYYQSLSLLGAAGSTSIEQDEDQRLLTIWKASSLWPKTGEYETSISGPEGRISQVSNFCPEVAFDRFGYFATYLGRYADEIDIGLAHAQLGKENSPPNDPRWHWARISPQHYTECPIYAVIHHQPDMNSRMSDVELVPWWRKHIVEIILGVAVTVAGGLILKFFGL